jgi:hypothetical protein
MKKAFLLANALTRGVHFCQIARLRTVVSCRYPVPLENIVNCNVALFAITQSQHCPLCCKKTQYNISLLTFPQCCQKLTVQFIYGKATLSAVLQETHSTIALCNIVRSVARNSQYITVYLCQQCPLCYKNLAV